MQSTLVIVQGLAGDHSDLTMALSLYDILLCSGTLVSGMSRVGVAGSWIWSPYHVVPGKRKDASGLRDGCICTRCLQSILPSQIECGCCEILFLGFVV